MFGNDNNVHQWFPLQHSTPEQKQQLGEPVSDKEPDDDVYDVEVATPVHVMRDSCESDFDDDVNGSGALHDIRLLELQNSIEHDNAEQTGEAEEDLEPAIEPNHGQKYIGQGRDNKTIWWSIQSEPEKERTVRMKQNRTQSFNYCKQNFNNKKKAFMRVFPPAIVEQIVLETNRKAERVYEANRHASTSQHMRPWTETNVDELYAYIAILIYSGAEKSHTVRITDLFDKSNMPFYRAVMPLKRFEQLSRFMRFDGSRTRMSRICEELSNPTWQSNQADKRKIFLKELAFDLAVNQMEQRCKNVLKKSTKIAMDLIGFKPKKETVAKRNMPKIQVKTESLSHFLSLSLSSLSHSNSQVKNPSRRCEDCKQNRRTKDNKTTAVCDFCVKPTCSMHYVRVCERCYLTKFKDPERNHESEEEEEEEEEGFPDDNEGPRKPPAKRPRSDSKINL